MAYPANLAFAGLAAFVLALPLVTALGAAVAAARSIDRWQREDNDSVFTTTFREFAATWRRTLVPGVGALAVVVVLLGDALFLWRQVNGDTSPMALLLAAATIPLDIAVALLLLAFPVAAARAPDDDTKAWLIGAGYLVARRPVRASMLLVIVMAFTLTCYLLPTVVPFFALSVPVYLALVSLGDDQASTDT